MKHVFQILTVVLSVFAFTSVSAASYHINDNAVNQMFASAQSVSISELSAAAIPGTAELGTTAFAGREKDPLVAILLDILVGGLGVHRFYLGTKPLTGIGYILTCGGIFGIVPLVDLIVMAVNYDDIGRYVGNSKFFMW